MIRSRTTTACAYIAAVIVASTARAQAPDFIRPPPPWQAALAASTDTAPGRAIAAQGKGAATACASCHGASGIPAAGVPFPYLAGMPAEYLAKQLVDYRDGTRANAVMGPIAKALIDADIGSLARLYASLKAPAIRIVPASASKRARQLQEIGDNALAIPACANCHGRAGTGGGPLLPALAAQPAAYTTSQLGAFRSDERKNDSDGVMRALAKRLSDADSKALGEYYAAMR
ncbi:MAG TPA: c-type cytochrome [Casimicrobiaceae bacterium]|jgi:cytochrome c553|nr:c-type cytochrome [Casimicrobiaceae bacterium]